MSQTKKSSVVLSRAVAAAVCVLGVGAGGAVAQEDEGAKQGRVLEEIIVSARKRDESIIDVPLSITTVTRDMIEDLNLTNMTDISQMTPGMFFTDFGSNRADRYNRQYIIRGLNVNSFQNPSAAAVLFVDGAPIVSGNLPGTLEIERVEVLKGPQTATFGRNTFTGAISVTTREPGNEWSGSAMAEIANYDSSQVAFSVDGPIIEDTLLIRLSASQRKKGGQYTNQYDGATWGDQGTTSFSTAIKWMPTEQATVRLSAAYYEFDDGPAADFRYIAADHNCDPGNTGTNTYFCGTAKVPQSSQLNERWLTKEWRDNTFPLLINSNDPKTKDAGLGGENLHFNLKLSYAFDNGMLLEAITGYDEQSSMTINQEYWSTELGSGGFLPPPTDFLYSLETEQEDMSQDIRLSSNPESRLRWSVGANYVYFSGYGQVTGDVSLGLLSLPGDRRESDTWGVFGSVYYDLSEKWELGLEGRYQNDEITVTTDNDPALGVVVGEWTAFTPRVSLSYKPNDNLSFFAVYAEGARSGAFNTVFANDEVSEGGKQFLRDLTGAQLEVDAELMDSFDIGVKGSLLDGRLFATATYYLGVITDQQTSQAFVLPPPDLLIGSVLVNEGESEFNGIELDFNFAATEALTLGGAYALNDTESTCCGSTQATSLSGGATDGTGNVLPFAPRQQGNLRFNYQMPLLGMDWYAGGEYIFIGERYASLANLVSTGDQELVNLRVGFRTENLWVELWGSNVFNNDAPAGISVPFDYVSFTGSGLQVNLPEKARYGLRATYEF